jgi:hypothetical protein
MSKGCEFLKENSITEISYEDAITKTKKELFKLGITSTEQLYDNDSVFDNGFYPENAELYDEFCDEYGFDVTEYLFYVAKRIKNS